MCYCTTIPGCPSVYLSKNTYVHVYSLYVLTNCPQVGVSVGVYILSQMSVPDVVLATHPVQDYCGFCCVQLFSDLHTSCAINMRTSHAISYLRTSMRFHQGDLASGPLTTDQSPHYRPVPSLPTSPLTTDQSPHYRPAPSLPTSPLTTDQSPHYRPAPSLPTSPLTTDQSPHYRPVPSLPTSPLTTDQSPPYRPVPSLPTSPLPSTSSPSPPTPKHLLDL